MKRHLLFIATFLLVFSLTAQAAVSVKVGTFDKSTAAAPVSQTVSWSDGDVFTPKAVIMFCTDVAAFGDTNADSGFIVGMATGSGSASYVTDIYMNDNQATSVNRKNSDTDDVIFGDLNGVTGGSLSSADFTSFGSREFTINWAVNVANANKILYIAIGGDTIAEAKVSNQTMSTGTGSQTYAHGLSGGAPDFVFFLSNNSTAPDALAHTSLSIGVATSSTSRWAIAIGAADAATTGAALNAVKAQSTSHCLHGMTAGGDALDYSFDYVSDDSTNVTLDQETAPAGAFLFAMLAIRGGDWTIGATNKTTSAAPASQVITTAAASKPALAFMASFNAATTASVISDAEMTLGMADGISEFNLGTLQEDGQINTETANLINNTKVFRIGSTTASAYTVASEADLTSLNSNGFTVNWTTNDTGVADELLWFTAGPASAGTGTVPILNSYRRRRMQ